MVPMLLLSGLTVISLFSAVKILKGLHFIIPYFELTFLLEASSVVLLTTLAPKMNGVIRYVIGVAFINHFWWELGLL